MAIFGFICLVCIALFLLFYGGRGLYYSLLYSAFDTVIDVIVSTVMVVVSIGLLFVAYKYAPFTIVLAAAT